MNSSLNKDAQWECAVAMEPECSRVWRQSISKSENSVNIRNIDVVYSANRQLSCNVIFVLQLFDHWLSLLSFDDYRSDEGLTLETSAFLPFTVANLRFQLSC